MSEVKNLFETLFDLENGYINKDILFLNDNNFIERFDKNKLGYILNNIKEISEIYRPDARNEVPLDKYYKLSSKNQLNVKYVQNDNGLYGRYQAVNAISGQGMVREARHTIFKDFYIDIDIDNCHPVITKWLCSNLDIECQYLNDYVYNREKHIKDLIKLNPECDREHFKKAFLKISYGCYDKTYNELVKNKTEFIINFRNEILNLQKIISERFFKFLEINTKLRNEKNKKYNYHGSTLSHICQFVENQLLMHMIKYLQDEKKLDIQDSILCFDGLMLNKDKFNIDFLSELENMFSNMDIDIKLSVKKMELDEFILKKCNYNSSKEYKYVQVIEQKFLDFKDEYYFMDFINDLIKDDKVWRWVELEEFFIKNVNRVMFLLLSQKNAFFGRYNNKQIQAIEPTGHIIRYVDNDGNMGALKFFKLLNIFFYNKVKIYNDLQFVPYTRDDQPSNISDKDFNLFQGFRASLLEKEDVNMDIIKPILDHWFIVLANSNDNSFKYQLSYFHRIFKYPSRRTKAMMLFKSDNQQIGKGILLNELIGTYIFGNQIYKANNGLSFINDRFNTDQSGALLNITEELSSIDDSYNSIFDKLKSLCCDSILKIEPKFGKKYDINNYSNYIFNTNNKFPVKIEGGDARYAVFECDERYHKNFTYFNNLAKHINQETADHLYSYIYHLKDVVDPRNIPNNKFYENIKFNSYHSSIRFLYAIKNVMEHNLDDGIEYDYESWQGLFVDKADFNSNVIKASDLNNIYKLWCKTNTERPTSMARFKQYTEKYIVHNGNSKFNFYDLSTLNLAKLEYE